jgi:hypothetical protein
VSAHLSVPRNEEYAGKVVHSVSKKPALVVAPALRPNTRTGQDVLGILGLLLVTAILGLAVYLVALYLS